MFGITINETTRSGLQNVAADRYRNLLIIGTSASALSANVNRPVEIRDLATFVNLFGTASPSYRTIQYILQYDPYCSLFFVCGRDPAATPGQLQNLQFGIAALVANVGLESAILCCAEGTLLAAQADRTALFSALDGLSSGARRKHLNYWNTALASTTKALALTERALYSSPSGSSVLCFEYLEFQTGVFVPLAAHQAAHHIKEGRSNPFDPPSGAKSTISGVIGVRGKNSVLTEADWTDFFNANINIPVVLPDRSVCVWNARTLATDSNLSSINSRVALTMSANGIRDVSMPFLQSSADKDGSLTRGLERALFGMCENLYQLGAYSEDDNDLATAFKIELVPDTSGTKKRMIFNVYVRLIDTLELITVNLSSVLAIPQ